MDQHEKIVQTETTNLSGQHDETNDSVGQGTFFCVQQHIDGCECDFDKFRNEKSPDLCRGLLFLYFYVNGEPRADGERNELIGIFDFPDRF